MIHFPPGIVQILRDGAYNSLYFSTNWKYQPLQFDYNSNDVEFANSSQGCSKMPFSVYIDMRGHLIWGCIRGGGPCRPPQCGS
jgi:hypothetical protein